MPALLLLLAIPGLLSAAVYAQTCALDHPSIAASSHDDFFTLLDQPVEFDAFTYFYYSATAGVTFTVYVEALTEDIDLCVSEASVNLLPDYESPYLSATESISEFVTITPAITECYAIGVYGYSGPDTFTIVVSGDTPAPTPLDPGTDAPTPFETLAPTPAPSSDQTQSPTPAQSTCEAEVGVDGFLEFGTLIKGDRVVEFDYTVPDDYTYFFYSTESFQEITIVAFVDQSYGDYRDLDLYINKYSRGFATKQNYLQNSAVSGNQNESVIFISDEKTCLCIGITSNSSLLFNLEITSVDRDLTSPSKLVLYLAVGIGAPVFICCVVPLTIGSILFYRKRSRKAYVNPGITNVGGTTYVN